MVNNKKIYLSGGQTASDFLTMFRYPLLQGNAAQVLKDPFNLVSAFLATPGRKGYLYAIDVDDRHKPVSRAEVEKWVKAWEKR